jgi:hypothetical protein
MSNTKWKDDLTPFERSAYRWTAYLALAVVSYCVVLLRKYPTSTAFFVTGLFALVIAMVFGAGCSKNVRVLDLRRFGERSGEHNSPRD